MRMLELQTFSMQIQTVRRLSVEGVSADGAVHAIRMGGVYTELVGATGLWIVGYTGSVCLYVGVTEILRFALDDI